MRNHYYLNHFADRLLQQWKVDYFHRLIEVDKGNLNHNRQDIRLLLIDQTLGKKVDCLNQNIYPWPMKLVESIAWEVPMMGKTSWVAEIATSEVVVEAVFVWNITGVVVTTVVDCPVVEISIFVAVIVVKEVRVCDWNYCCYSSKRYKNGFCRSIDCSRLWSIGCARKDCRNWKDLLLFYCDFKCI